MFGATHGILIDVTRCIGCRSCVLACMERHGVDDDPEDVLALSARHRTAMVEYDGGYARRMCMHCVDPSCASVCPVEALIKNPGGAVTYDASRCLGCRYCIQACPFNVPRYEWDNPVPAVSKCDLCHERTERGELPACVDACPAEALLYGPREELLAEAHQRIADDPGSYVPHVFGETELGGTSVLFLSPVPFEQLGFPADLGDQPFTMLTGEALDRVPGIVVVGGSVLWAIWWISRRREEVAAAEAAGEDVA